MIRANDPTLLNVTYIRPSKADGQQERFEVVYKTPDGKVHKADEPAEADIWIVKPECRDFTYNKPQERIDRMDKIRVPISQIRKAIADQMGDAGKEIIRRAYETGEYGRLNDVYRWPYAFAADFQPEYYYMKEWYDRYPLGTPKLSVAYLDIETDIIDYVMDMEDIPNTAHSPVNLATVMLDETNESWTFVLRPYEPSRIGLTDAEYQERYDLYLKQKADHERFLADKNIVISKLHEEFDPTYGPMDYHIREYEKEIDLITDIFRLINTRKPNFCLMWNMRFDIQYLYYRIKTLGYQPEDIICHPDFKNPRCYFKQDKTTYQISKQFDSFYCSSYTQYLCQMRIYSNIRKSQHTLRSVSLNAISDRELRDRKVEYPENANIARFAYLDWLMFMVYNVKDVKLQQGIEHKCKDVLTYYMRSHSNLTPYNKIFRETHLLRNVREMYFEREGWVQGNNVNILNARKAEADPFYGNPDSDDSESGGGTSFKGAINAEPSMNDNVGLMVLGRRSNNLFANSMDYDMGAFYPSIKIASNMDPGTLLYKASFINDEFISGERPNRSLNQKYQEKDKKNQLRSLDITGEAVNTYASGNVLSFGYNYLGYPSITEIMERLKRTSVR